MKLNYKHYRENYQNYVLECLDSEDQFIDQEPTDQEIYERSFIEEPGILDKHKAAAVIVDGKCPLILYTHPLSLYSRSRESYWSRC